VGNTHFLNRRTDCLKLSWSLWRYICADWGGGGGENESSVELTGGPAVLKLRNLLPQVGTEAAQRKYLTPRSLITVIS